MTGRARYAAGLLAAALGGGACASTPPPKELVDARASYEKVSQGPAAKLTPADLHIAQEALAKAERAFNDAPSAEHTRDLAYVAQRKAQLADAKAALAADENNKAKAQADLQSSQVQTAQRTQKDLQQARSQLNRETEARTDAERRAKEALDNLARIAALKEEPRGMVITLSGEVLFASGKYELLPVAQDKLAQVAAALKEQKDRTFVVEGHTDSNGARDMNMELSQHRAQSVRDYLVSRGVPPDRISATGIGPDRPVADNKTPEGRANNRRVEIIVQPRRG